MNDITAFFGKCLDGDQAVAQAALEAAASGKAPARTPGAWHAPGEDPGQPSDFELCFEPEQILLNIAASRRVLDEFLARDRDADLMLGPSTLRQREWVGLRLAVQLLMQAHADDPDFEESWRLP